MKKHLRLILPILALLTVICYLVFSLPKLPPAGALGTCTICHWDKKDHPAHRDLDFGTVDCMLCHNPHTHFGKPYLQSIDSCLICHFELKPKPGQFVHKPAQKGQCLSCHTRHKLFEKSSLVAETHYLCFVCHRDESLRYETPVGHLPYDKGQCLSCHDPHMSPYRGILHASPDILCGSCHRQWLEWRRPVQHMPFEKGNCLDCHVAHVSQWDGLIKQDQITLCYSCHFDRKRELSRPYKHGPYGTGDCTACHEPHSSAGQNLLPREEMEQFCYICHSDYAKYEEEALYTHAQATDDSCLSCHEHHSSFHKYLTNSPLSGQSFCIDCHVSDIGEYYLRSEHRNLSCDDCHSIHGSNFQFLLHDFEVALCSGCHSGLSHRSTNHPVGHGYQDILRDRLLLCSSCHGPHGTPYPKMTVRGKNDLCLPCHNENIR